MALFSTAWIDIPVVDMARAKAFYETLFEGECSEMPTPGAEASFRLPWIEGRVAGALVKMEGRTPAKEGVLLYFNVGQTEGEGLEIVLTRAETAGATVTLPKTDIGGENGHMGIFTDPEGNQIGLWSMY